MAKKNYKAEESVKRNTADNLLLTEENIYGTLNANDSIKGTIESFQTNIDANIIPNDFKEPADESYYVRVIYPNLRKRRTPSLSGEVVGYITDKGIYKIVKNCDGWGQLEDGNWIMLSYTQSQ